MPPCQVSWLVRTCRTWTRCCSPRWRWAGARWTSTSATSARPSSSGSRTSPSTGRGSAPPGRTLHNYVTEWRGTTLVWDYECKVWEGGYVNLFIEISTGSPLKPLCFHHLPHMVYRFSKKVDRRKNDFHKCLLQIPIRKVWKISLSLCLGSHCNLPRTKLGQQHRIVITGTAFLLCIFVKHRYERIFWMAAFRCICQIENTS